MVMQTVTSSLNSVNSSLSAVPDLTSYIASLTPAVTAYAALGPTIISDMQSQITSINSSITSVIRISLLWLRQHHMQHVWAVNLLSSIEPAEPLSISVDCEGCSCVRRYTGCVLNDEDKAWGLLGLSLSRRSLPAVNSGCKE